MKKSIKSLVAVIVLSILLLSASCGIKQDEAYIYQAMEVASSVPLPTSYDSKDGEPFTYGEIKAEIYRFSPTTGEPIFKITINYGKQGSSPDLSLFGQPFAQGTLYLVCPNEDNPWWHWDISLSELTAKSSLLWWQ